MNNYSILKKIKYDLVVQSRFDLIYNEKISLKQIVEISEKFLQKKIKVIELNAKEPSIRNINSIKAQNLLNWKLNIKFKNYIKNLCYK